MARMRIFLFCIDQEPKIGEHIANIDDSVTSSPPEQSKSDSDEESQLTASESDEFEEFEVIIL